MIIAHTIKGKGVSFMENKVEWHGKAPNEQEYRAACLELEGESKMNFMPAKIPTRRALQKEW